MFIRMFLQLSIPPRAVSQIRIKGRAITQATNIKRRSADKITELVQKRVQERNSWKVRGHVEGSHPSWHEFVNAMLTLMTTAQPTMRECDFQSHPMDWDRIRDARTHQVPNVQLTWLGHASLLIQLGRWNILTDPVFSERCAPVQWAGPKRLRPPPCTVTELLDQIPIHTVLISHNHYDHLDYTTVKALAAADEAIIFVMPLGLKSWFQSHVVADEDRTIELDWHENTSFSSPTSDLTVTAVPARHWSNRIGDRDQTLWCGYSIVSNQRKILFAGDTAWFDAMYDIGSTYGPFDVAAIPIGAYEPRSFMRYYHLNPCEAIEMKDAVRAHYAVPIHYGTFPLTHEPFLEPEITLGELMATRPDKESFVPWRFGETKSF